MTNRVWDHVLSGLAEVLHGKEDIDALVHFVSLFHVLDERDSVVVEGTRQRWRSCLQQSSSSDPIGTCIESFLLSEGARNEDGWRTPYSVAKPIPPGTPTWEGVTQGNTARLSVPGGWLYRYDGANNESSLAFVPGRE
jgi:hypothetical protein